ncbi:MAG: sulfite exporter TauE/SafE family protein [Clostridia bacterium]|nr:sulfite exporter TauE/SafE family protein [Clostridia bacterium]
MTKKIMVGLFAGIVCGLFSSGGGLILVPAFIYILKFEDTRARATSLFCILPMVVLSAVLYAKENYMDWKIGIYCAIGGIAGGIIGAKLLKKVPTKYLKISFTILLFYFSIKMIKA